MFENGKRKLQGFVQHPDQDSEGIELVDLINPFHDCSPLFDLYPRKFPVTHDVSTIVPHA